MDKLQLPRWETRHIFLCLPGKENHLHFILYLLLSSAMEMDLKKRKSSHRLMERRRYISHQTGLQSIYICSISPMFSLIVMSTFLSRSQSACYFLPICGDQVFMLLQVKYPGNDLQKQPFVLSAPWEGHITETPHPVDVAADIVRFLSGMSMRSPHNFTSWSHLLLQEEMLFADKSPTTHKCHAERFLFLEKWLRAHDFNNLLHYRRGTNDNTWQSCGWNTQSSRLFPEGESRRKLEGEFIICREAYFL